MAASRRVPADTPPRQPLPSNTAFPRPDAAVDRFPPQRRTPTDSPPFLPAISNPQNAHCLLVPRSRLMFRTASSAARSRSSRQHTEPHHQMDATYPERARSRQTGTHLRWTLPCTAPDSLDCSACPALARNNPRPPATETTVHPWPLSQTDSTVAVSYHPPFRHPRILSIRNHALQPHAEISSAYATAVLTPTSAFSLPPHSRADTD